MRLHNLSVLLIICQFFIRDFKIRFFFGIIQLSGEQMHGKNEMKVEGENMSEEINLSGHVQIADEVIANIASTATLEAEGVVDMAGYFTGDIAGKLRGKKSAKGVALLVEEGKVHISVDIVVRSGVKIQTVAGDVQQKVKNAIETMTGYTADEVNVNVIGLVA